MDLVVAVVDSEDVVEVVVDLEEVEVEEGLEEDEEAVVVDLSVEDEAAVVIKLSRISLPIPPLFTRICSQVVVFLSVVFCFDHIIIMVVSSNIILVKCEL